LGYKVYPKILSIRRKTILVLKNAPVIFLVCSIFDCYRPIAPRAIVF
jgi:hypothetical protein